MLKAAIILALPSYPDLFEEAKRRFLEEPATN
jgi:hypothetical protein